MDWSSSDWFPNAGCCLSSGRSHLPEWTVEKSENHSQDTSSTVLDFVPGPFGY